MNDVKKILLVDDDLDLLEQSKIQLEAKGYKVVAALNGMKGWELFKSEKPDAAVIDLIMEEHDSGFILAHKIKRDSYGKGIPVFILTSATLLTGLKFGATTKDEKEWIKCDEILNKPVAIDELVQKLEEHFTLRVV